LPEKQVTCSAQRSIDSAITGSSAAGNAASKQKKATSAMHHLCAKWGTLISTAAILLGASACGSDENNAAQKKTVTRVPVAESEFKPVELENTIGNLLKEIENAPPESVQLDIILKTLTGYWEPVKTGAGRAIDELDVFGGVVGPSELSDSERSARQRQIIQDDINAGYNAFGVAPMDNTVGDEYDKAVDLGSPVVTIDSDLPASKRAIYIGTINYEAGDTAGKTLLSYLSADQGTVILLGHDNESDWPDGYQRTKGASDVLAEAGYTVVIRKTTWTDTGEAEDVAYLKEQLQTANPPVVGMLGMFSVAYRCALAAEAVGKTGSDIAIVGFDFDTKTVDFMRSGLMKATHAQRQYYMGYMAPYVLYGISALGLEKTKAIISPQMVDGARFNSGLDVVAADKLDDYNAFLDSLGVTQ
jgi:ribose transport system substrate-binding protein